jgi:hypothetical protein
MRGRAINEELARIKNLKATAITVKINSLGGDLLKINATALIRNKSAKSRQF